MIEKAHRNTDAMAGVGIPVQSGCKVRFAIGNSGFHPFIVKSNQKNLKIDHSFLFDV